jgi:nucleotide-binding universal stress UspA family protein
VETHVHHEEGRPGTSQREVAEALADHAAELGFDLAVMAAHGRRAASNYLWASLPLKVAAAGCASVYLARRSPGAKAWTPPASILLPLDGRPEHEAALAQAVALAKALKLPLALLAVVPRRPADSLGKEGALVVLSTHRRLGFDAALEGCVAFAVATRYSGESLIAPVPRCKD